ncbi:MAG TPA: nucleoside monophosphate kinase, partial [Actinomycetota bacterium]|nr:nucleoside monophosphate kinase [Actinomycetota bacterium]
PHVATGDMLRAAVEDESELGERVRPILASGHLVPDDLMIELIRQRLHDDDTGNGFVLDGFPRTFVQARALDDMLGELDRALALVLEFQLPEEMARERLLGRGRSDDNEETIRTRLERQRVPEELVAYYRTKGILVGIHADGTVDEVFAEVQDVLATAAAR